MHRLCLAILLCVATLGPAVAASGSFAPIYREGQDPWKYFGGDEFPGASGRVSVDATQRKSGSRSLRLDADFSGGGAYVSTLRAVGDVDPIGLAFWVRSENVTEVGIRFTDGSGQTHQTKGVPVKEGEWTLVRLRRDQIVGGEHWGGKDDGQWHGPLKSVTLMIGKNDLMRPARAQGSLWFDDIALEVEAQ